MDLRQFNISVTVSLVKHLTFSFALLYSPNMELDVEEQVKIILVVQKVYIFECCCQCQIVTGFKARNVKKLKDLLASTSKSNCTNCKCHSQQTVDWK